MRARTGRPDAVSRRVASSWPARGVAGSGRAGAAGAVTARRDDVGATDRTTGRVDGPVQRVAGGAANARPPTSGAPPGSTSTAPAPERGGSEWIRAARPASAPLLATNASNGTSGRASRLAGCRPRGPIRRRSSWRRRVSTGGDNGASGGRRRGETLSPSARRVLPQALARPVILAPGQGRGTMRHRGPGALPA